MLLKKQHWVGLLVFLAMLGFTAISVNLVYQLRKSNEKDRLQVEINAKTDRLNDYLSETRDILGTLEYIIANYGFPHSLDTIGRQLLKPHSVVSAIEYVEDSTITHVYPSKGNEIVVGYNLLEDSTRNEEAFKAINSRSLYFAGPLKLRQGGIGIIGRMPIFKDSQYLGLAAAIIYLDTLLAKTGIYPNKSTELEYMLVKTYPNTNKTEVYLPFRNFNPEKDIYTMTKIPGGDWELYVRARANSILNSMIPLAVAGVLFSILSGFFAFYLVRQPELLKKLVNNKIKEVKRNELLISLTQESARIGSWSIDLNTRQLTLTPMAREVYGLNEDSVPELNDFIGLCYEQEDKLLFETALLACMNKGQNFDIDIKINRSNKGAPYWVRVTGLIHVEEGKHSVFGATQDIDSHVKTSAERSSILSSIQDAFVACDEDWNVIYWNKAAEKMFNISSESISGRKLLDYISEHTKEDMFQEFFNSENLDNTYNFEFYSSVQNIWCEVSMYRMPTGFTAFIKDVTERHHYVQRIEEQNKVLRDITWVQSHVVRAPLARLLGGVDLLSHETDKAKMARLLEIIRESALELDDIVKDIIEKSEDQRLN